VLTALNESALVFSLKLCVLTTIITFSYRTTFHAHYTVEVVSSVPRNMVIMEIYIF